MSNIKVSYTGDGVTVLYTIPFQYLNRDHVKVSVNGSGTSAFTFANDTTIQFNTAPANGADIVLERETTADAAENTFFPNSSIRSSALNDNFLQTLYVSEEAREIAADAQLGNIVPGSIGTAILADGAVTTAKLATNAVATTNIIPGSIDTAILADGAVTNAKLGAAAVDNTKLATNSVATTNIQDNAITNPKLGDNCVNTAELADSSVSTIKIANSAVTEAKTGFSALLNYVYLTSPGSGTYTPTAGTKRILVEVWGAGGGGGGVNGIANSGWWAKGGSGGGGGYCSKWIASGLDASYSYTVGAGGSGGAAGQNDGSAGGTSTFSGTGVSLTANAGSGGDGKSADSNGTLTYGANGGGASGGDLNIQGGKASGNTNYTRLDADSYSGAGWGFPVTQSVGPQGPGGGSAGSNGINPSEGGTGARVEGISTNYAGGDGSDGLIKITEYFV